MARTALKASRRQRIRKSIRNKINGTPARPRLCVFRSNKEIYAQLIDDVGGITLASASSEGVKGDGKNKIDIAKVVGTDIGEKARSLGVEEIVFDRGGYLYHGRVKALADAARETGLKF